MRDDFYPTIWAKHTKAEFNPVLMQGRLITVIDDAPEDWCTKLSELGFKKGRHAWLKIGSLGPAEYEYLSPSIRLVAFEPGTIINSGAIDQSSTVPVLIRDSVVALWCDHLDGVLLELGLLGVKSKSDAWSHVEAALAGDVTPEAEAILHLAFVKMSLDGTLVGPALAFAKDRGWREAQVSAPAIEGVIVAHAGQTVHWTDENHVKHVGRAAATFRLNDEHVWVYENGPCFVAGTSYTAIGKVPKNQVEEVNSVDTRTLRKGGGVRIADISSVPKKYYELDACSEIESANVFKLIWENGGYFPSEGWKNWLNTNAKDESPPDIRRSFEILAALESQISDLSTKYYRESGIHFFLAVTGDYSSGKNAEVFVGHIGSSSAGYTPTKDIRPKVETISKTLLVEACESADNLFRLKVKDFEAAAIEFGKLKGISAAIPATILEDICVKQVVQHLEDSERNSEITEGELTSALAAVCSARKFKNSVLASSNGKGEMHDLLSLESIIESGSLNIGISKIKLDLVEIGSLHQSLQMSVNPALVEGVEASFSYYSSSSAGLLSESIKSASKAMTSMSDDSFCMRPYVDYEVASCVVLDFIDGLGDINDLNSNELARLRSSIPTAGYEKRISAAVKLIKNISSKSLLSWLDYELQDRLKHSAAAMSGTLYRSTLNKCVDGIRGAEGLILIVRFSPSGTKTFVHPITVSADTFVKSRQEILGAAVSFYGSSARKQDIVVAIDALSFTDPELRTAMAGTVVRPEMRANLTLNDDGLDPDLLMADIRNYSSQELIERLTHMRPGHRSKYTKRELIWPRMSLDELLSKGLDRKTAIAIEVLWKNLPEFPKSESEVHIAGYVELLACMRDGVRTLINKYAAGGFRAAVDGKILSKIDHFELDMFFRAFTRDVCSSLIVREAYGNEDYILRGCRGVKINDYSPLGANPLVATKPLSGSSWGQLINGSLIGTKRQNVSTDAALKKLISAASNKYVVLPEDFIKTFGFYKVESADALSEPATKNHLGTIYESMIDFTNLLDLEPTVLSFGGVFGLFIKSDGAIALGAAGTSFDIESTAYLPAGPADSNSVSAAYWRALYSCLDGILQASTEGYDEASQQAFATTCQPSTLEGPLPFVRALKSLMDQSVAIVRQFAAGSNAYPMFGNASSGNEESSAAKENAFVAAMVAWTRSESQKRVICEDHFTDACAEIIGDEGRELMQRIDVKVREIIFVLEHYISSVKHQFAGETEATIIHDAHRCSLVLGGDDLLSLAEHEVESLFNRYMPRHTFDSAQGARTAACSYMTSVVSLCNQSRGNFHYDCWRAYSSLVLLGVDRENVMNCFSPDLQVRVFDAMRAYGTPHWAMEAAESEPEVLQAYAFQLWSLGCLALNGENVDEFYRAKGLIEGVVAIHAIIGDRNMDQVITLHASAGANSSLRGAQFKSGADYSRYILNELPESDVYTSTLVLRA